MDTATEVTGTQIITLDPEKYVAAVFAPFRDRLDVAKASAATIKADVSTREGMAVAIKQRAIFRSIRIEVEAARKLRKAPILEISRKLDGRAKELEAEIAPDEDRFDAAIKAEETRKEVERAAREQAERERVEKIQAAIAELRAIPIKAVGKSALVIEQLANDLNQQFTDDRERYQEFAAQAETAVVESANKLAELLTAAREHETMLEQARKDREELARRKAAEDKRQLEAAEREAAEIRARAEADAKRRAEIAAEEAAANERIAAQARAAQAEIDRLAKEARERQATEDARQQAERDRIAEQARQVEAAARAQREATEAAERRQRDESEAKAKAERDAQEARAKAEEEQRQKDEWTRDAEREAKRKEAEQFDARQMLLSFVARFGHMSEFAKVCKAIDVALNHPKKQAA